MEKPFKQIFVQLQNGIMVRVASIPEKVFNREIEKAKQESEKRIELTTGRMLAGDGWHTRQIRAKKLRGGKSRAK